MAKVVPSSRQELIAWYAQRAPVWAANAVAIGLDPAQVATLAGLVSAAEGARDDAFAARAVSVASTGVYHTETDVLKDFGAGLVKTIKAFADATDDVNVYFTATIPPPSPPAPLWAPEAPTDVTTVLKNTGSIEIEWQGSREGGTSFLVERSVTPVGGTAGPWVLLDSVEERTFADEAVPQGLAVAVYRVFAKRSGGISDASQTATIFFGTEGASGATDLTLAA
jgi:hypothetical protein